MRQKAARLSGPPAWTLGDRIRRVRRTLGLSQVQLAAELGISQASLARYEVEESRPPDVVAFARRMEDVTGVPAVWLLGLDEPAPALHAGPLSGIPRYVAPEDAYASIPFPRRGGLRPAA